MSETRTPIEVTTRYATTVDDIPAAWAFIMSVMDDPKVGPDPSVTIKPTWVVHDAGVDYEKPPRHFEVVVSGMVERSREAHAALDDNGGSDER